MKNSYLQMFNDGKSRDVIRDTYIVNTHLILCADVYSNDEKVKLLNELMSHWNDYCKVSNI